MYTENEKDPGDLTTGGSLFLTSGTKPPVEVLEEEEDEAGVGWRKVA